MKAELREHFAALLRSCCGGGLRGLGKGRRVHEEINASRQGESRFLSNLLVQMYGRCGSLDEACCAFDEIRQPNLYSWNILLTAFWQNGHLQGAKNTFDRMDQRDVVSWNCLIVVMAEEISPDPAQSVFERMPCWDVVSLNTMIQANAHNGRVGDAKQLFDRMKLAPNLLSFTALVQGHVCDGDLSAAIDAFSRMSQHDAVSCTAMIQGYGNAGQLKMAKMMFDELRVRDVVAWTVLAVAYAQNGLIDEASSVFSLIPALNVFSWTGMIAAFGQNMSVREAKSVFDCMPERNVVSWNATVAALAQNGDVLGARALFDRMAGWNGISWVTMVAEYAHFGNGRDALGLFRVMNLEGVGVDSAAFVMILMACSHVGLVEEGWRYFIAMAEDHGVVAAKQHFCAMVSTLSKAGQLREAEDLIDHMPFQPSAVEWGAFLVGCKAHQHVEMGEIAAAKLFVLEPNNSSPYSLLAEMYSASSSAEEVKSMNKR